MKKSIHILTYTFSFLILAFLFKFIGLITSSKEEILSFTFIFYGVSSVFVSIGKNAKLRLFLGAIIFLIGIVFFIFNNFEIINFSKAVLPSIFLILGFGCLMLYIDNTEDKAIFFTSLIFILIGTVYSMIWGFLRPVPFLYSIYYIALKYWVIVLIAFLVVVALSGEDKKKIE